jgi:hypothetical protein
MRGDISTLAFGAASTVSKAAPETVVGQPAGRVGFVLTGPSAAMRGVAAKAKRSFTKTFFAGDQRAASLANAFRALSFGDQPHEAHRQGSLFQKRLEKSGPVNAG